MMANYKKLTGEYIHRIFCEILDVTPIKDLDIIGLDDMEYYQKVEDEGMGDDTIPAFYKRYSNGAELFVNEDELNNDPYRVVDVIMTQLFDIYSDTLPMYEQSYEIAHKLPLRGVDDGYKYWFEFSISYMSMSLLRQAFDPDELFDEHGDKSLKDRYLQLLSDVTSDEETLDTKVSTVLYLFGKLAYFENMNDVKGFARFFGKKKFTNINDFVNGEIGKALNNTYQHLMKSVLQPYSSTDYMKLNKLMLALQDQLINRNLKDGDVDES